MAEFENEATPTGVKVVALALGHRGHLIVHGVQAPVTLRLMQKWRTLTMPRHSPGQQQGPCGADTIPGGRCK